MFSVAILFLTVKFADAFRTTLNYRTMSTGETSATEYLKQICNIINLLGDQSNPWVTQYLKTKNYTSLAKLITIKGFSFDAFFELDLDETPQEVIAEYDLFVKWRENTSSRRGTLIELSAIELRETFTSDGIKKVIEIKKLPPNIKDNPIIAAFALEL